MQKVNVTPFGDFCLVNTFASDGGNIFERIPYMIDDEGNLVNDCLKEVSYTGQTSLNNGQMTLNFQIKGAKSLPEAIKLWASTVEGVIDDIQSRELQNRIAKPGLIDLNSRKR